MRRRESKQLCYAAMFTFWYKSYTLEFNCFGFNSYDLGGRYETPKFVWYHILLVV